MKESVWKKSKKFFESRFFDFKIIIRFDIFSNWFFNNRFSFFIFTILAKSLFRSFQIFAIIETFAFKLCLTNRKTKSFISIRNFDWFSWISAQFVIIKFFNLSNRSASIITWLSKTSEKIDIFFEKIFRTNSRINCFEIFFSNKSENFFWTFLMFSATLDLSNNQWQKKVFDVRKFFARCSIWWIEMVWKID